LVGIFFSKSEAEFLFSSLLAEVEFISHSFNNTNNSPALWQERCRGISQVQNILVSVTVMHFSD
jgi:hypothetical protein